MKLTDVPRLKPRMETLDFIKAALYMVENGCKWRALSNEFGNWHTVCVRFN